MSLGDFINVPNDIINYLLGFLDNRDVVALALTSMTFYKKIWELKLHMLTHDCRDEIKDEWNSRVERVSNVARYGGYTSDNLGDYHRSKSTSSSDAFNAEMVWDCRCTVFPWRTHHLRLEYVYGPRDVDILSWFINKERIGYTMM